EEHALLQQHIPAVLEDLAKRTPLLDAAGVPLPLWLCSICHESITNHQRPPPFSMQNNLLLADVPSQLLSLNYMERHLISRVRPFHSLVYLPFGQLSARGLSISYPADVTELRD